MAFRFRKSIKLAPGIRLNVGKRGVGISAGAKGAHIGVNSRGQLTTSSSIPGTGLSWRSTSGKGKKRSSSSPAPENAPVLPYRPGLIRMFFGFLNIVAGIIAFGPDNIVPMLIEIVIGTFFLAWGMVAFEKSKPNHTAVKK